MRMLDLRDLTSKSIDEHMRYAQDMQRFQRERLEHERRADRIIGIVFLICLLGWVGILIGGIYGFFSS